MQLLVWHLMLDYINTKVHIFAQRIALNEEYMAKDGKLSQVTLTISGSV